MYEGVEIKGGAGEFEAAVIAIVLDNLAREENAARQQAPKHTNEMPAWMRAVPQLLPHQPGTPVNPEGR